MAKKSELEELLASQFKEMGWRPRRQFKFHPMRKFKADFAWVGKKILVEVDGGIYSRYGAKRCPLCQQLPRGGHITHFDKDRERDNLAQLAGWQVFRFTASMVKDRSALYFMERVLDPGHTGRDVTEDVRLTNRKRSAGDSGPPQSKRRKRKKQVEQDQE